MAAPGVRPALGSGMVTVPDGSAGRVVNVISANSGRLLARMDGIGKRFGHVQVLRDVRFEVYAGEVHILAGENGVAKSTLINTTSRYSQS